ncbi:Cytochrome P450 [Gossypium arboreum]|uniref:Cytochrome P450 n=1 Tax=Gossypium arboreum TaxID=29729 RepID=A0A0B0P9E0_GOSAR|nr:Cytochrome P450 [Gossypium arboreum]
MSQTWFYTGSHIMVDAMSQTWAYTNSCISRPMPCPRHGLTLALIYQCRCHV